LLNGATAYKVLGALHPLRAGALHPLRAGALHPLRALPTSFTKRSRSKETSNAPLHLPL